ncbi:zinc finger protein ZAT11 [Ricinus communis]|uniref:Zinc finger protein, putative n=1 Tax=Ricinus communis TaxID=3988 RepID=B9T431_RICCO|nr:zinc finger protein ZAT11 [Ricinus communis]EEF29375.1 zinc finger protein, putative [Ricinus communis]|eukprot:XP_002533000.1 zinc finger protein ZAT11 [Ricinus communis]
MAMKRVRQDAEFDSLDMAKCLMLLSHNLVENSKPTNSFIRTSSNDNMFECKTCNKKFSSFQALGGHRASHKRPRLFMGPAADSKSASSDDQAVHSSGTKKPKMHECSICGVEFALGQALGGHMRRHRAAAMAQTFASSAKVKNTGCVVQKLPVLRRSNSSKRVFGLDLNLTPLENDLEYLFGKMAPKVDLFV